MLLLVWPRELRPWCRGGDEDDPGGVVAVARLWPIAAELDVVDDGFGGCVEHGYRAEAVLAYPQLLAIRGQSQGLGVSGDGNSVAHRAGRGVDHRDRVGVRVGHVHGLPVSRHDDLPWQLTNAYCAASRGV